MYPLKQSTALTVPFFAHDENGDGVTGITSVSFTKRISKNGGAFAAMTVAISELENGWYSLPVSTTHSNTSGVLSVSLSAGACKRVNLQFRVFGKLIDDLNDIAQTDIVSDSTAFPGASLTEVRLAELASANLPADIDTLLTRITAAVALASVCTETRLAELDAGNIPTDLSTISAYVDELETRLTAARAGYLDSLNGHTAQTGDNYARLGAPAGASMAADLLAIDNFVDDLESRLTAARAGYLDELGSANIPADIDTLLTRITAAVALASALSTHDTDIKALLPAALVGGRMSSDAVAISGSTDAANKLEASAETIVLGTVSHDNTVATTTVFYSDDIVEATADHFNGRIVLFVTGDLIQQATSIEDYELVAGEGKFTVVALTEAPADNVQFIIV